MHTWTCLALAQHKGALLVDLEQTNAPGGPHSSHHARFSRTSLNKETEATRVNCLHIIHGHPFLTGPIVFTKAFFTTRLRIYMPAF